MRKLYTILFIFISMFSENKASSRKASCEELSIDFVPLPKSSLELSHETPSEDVSDLMNSSIPPSLANEVPPTSPQTRVKKVKSLALSLSKEIPDTLKSPVRFPRKEQTIIPSDKTADLQLETVKKVHLKTNAGSISASTDDEPLTSSSASTYVEELSPSSSESLDLDAMFDISDTSSDTDEPLTSSSASTDVDDLLTLSSESDDSMSN